MALATDNNKKHGGGDKAHRKNGHANANGHNDGHGGNGHVRLMDLNHVSPEKGIGILIDRALELRASDLFLVTNEQHVAVQVRMRGQVEQVSVLAPEQGKRYI